MKPNSSRTVFIAFRPKPTQPCLCRQSRDESTSVRYRLQQLTSLKVDPDCRVLSLTEPELFDYPWIYVVEPGAMRLDDAEVRALRKYLLSGGFLMADDFWGPLEWQNFEHEIKRAMPEREFVELPMDHPLFHCVFPLKVPKNQLQGPNYWTGENSLSNGVTWEYHDGEECREVHIRALFDQKGHMMAI